MKLVHELNIDVRWGDMDAVGHVNNATYFTYFEQARVAWLATLGQAVMSEVAGPVMATAVCEFRRPLTWPARVTVRVLAGPPGNTSLPTAYELVDADDPGVLYARGESVLVWFDHRAGEKAPLPDSIRAALNVGADL